MELPGTTETERNGCTYPSLDIDILGPTLYTLSTISSCYPK